MTLSTIILAAVLTACANAHTRFTTLHINGQSQGDGVCIRQDQDPGTTTNYVPSITGPEMACGIDGTIANPSTCNANAGDQISLEHREWPDASQPGAIDVSHKGNTAVYMKKINSESDEVTGSGWFKIYFDGYDTATGEWGTDHMNANNGLVTTNIPSDLAAGSYLIRSEVLALQEVGEPQFYIGCAQIQLSGSGSAVPSDTATIPGYVDMSTPDMNVNIYESFTFTEYGPVVYGSGSGATNATSTSNTANSSLSSSKTGPTSLATPSPPITSSTTSTSSSQAASTDEGDSTDNDDSSNDLSSGQNSWTAWISIASTSTDITGDSDDQSTDEKAASGWKHRWAEWNNAAKRAARSVQRSAA